MLPARTPVNRERVDVFGAICGWIHLYLFVYKMIGDYCGTNACPAPTYMLQSNMKLFIVHHPSLLIFLSPLALCDRAKPDVYIEQLYIYDLRLCMCFFW